MVTTYDQRVEDDLLFGTISAAKHSFAFNEKKSGFTLHTFSDDFSTLTTAFIDTGGNTLHSFVTQKDGKPSPPAPPSPSPKPSGKVSCAKYGCQYSPTFKCQCNYQCDAHNDCCPDYEDVCTSKEDRRRSRPSRATRRRRVEEPATYV